MIPFIDLPSQHAEIADNVESDILDCIRKCQYNNGYYLERFEHSFGKYLGINHVIGTSSGTDAMMLVCEGLNIGYGDYVILPNNISINIAFGISRAGAIPIFVDVHPYTYLINTDAVTDILTHHPRKKKVKAILASDLYGQMPNLKGLQEIARNFKVLLIEDASHSIGATYKHNPVGWYSDAAITSFNPTRNLGSIGQGGAVLTNDTILSKKVRVIINQGQEKNHHYVTLGGNYKLDSIIASQLYHALQKLEEWNDRRRTVAKRYNDAFTSNQRPTQQPCAKHVYHIYPFKCRSSLERDALEREFILRHIGYGLHYPATITDSPMYLSLVDTPNAYYLRDRLISLPIHPFVTEDQSLEVIRVVQSVCGSSE